VYFVKPSPGGRPLEELPRALQAIANTQHQPYFGFSNAIQPTTTSMSPIQIALLGIYVKGPSGNSLVRIRSARHMGEHRQSCQGVFNYLMCLFYNLNICDIYEKAINF
jgi:hypothetical protein